MTARTLVALALAAFASASLAAPDKPECIAGAKPGGGFDLTCKLAQQGMQEAKMLSSPMRITYMPGGVGAVAMNALVGQRPTDGNAIVAFSGGSLLNIAQGKFGKWTENDVRWVAAIGTDYGCISVRADSPHKTLKDLMNAIKADPTKIAIGGGGSVGSQDWTKTATLAKQIGVDPKALRYVSFEGNGEVTTALLGGHIQAGSGDISADLPQHKAGKIRILAVYSDKRLPGDAANIPTAIESGYNFTWPIIRGFYVAPKISEADYKFWLDSFNKLLASKDFLALRDQRDLYPFSMTGAELDAYVKKTVAEYRKVADEFGLIQK
ncbi:MAG TPA: tripartite tricarboxylate transporter substrate binding protein [Casimicrobiaceae bacterium]|nr:tripartite tricarboxylate transporter substrate binding protein [Casimicrobiaceae bacterium]